MLLCKFCNKECINENSLRNHERLCKSNLNRQIMDWDNPRKTGKPGENQYTKAKKLGIEIPKVTEETKNKLSIASKNQVWDETRRKKHSESMKKAVLEHPESYTSSNVCGRVKIENYKGEKFHGKWELEFAKWLDANNIKWERKVNPFNYYWNDSWHLYFPDFYIPEFDLYVEVKGYETDRDKCKWSVVKNLKVIKQKEIKQIRENTFVLITH